MAKNSGSKSVKPAAKTRTSAATSRKRTARPPASAKALKSKSAGSSNKQQSTQVSPARQPGRTTPRSGPRRMKQPTYRTLRLSKRIKHPVKLPSVWRLTGKTFRTLWRYKWLLLGISAIYGIVNLLLVTGLSNDSDLTTLKNTLQQAIGGHTGQFTSSLAVFFVLLGSAGNSSSGTTGSYQFILIVIGSLAVVWALRQALSGARVSVRDAYYRGMYPLIPFVLILLVIGLQLIPLVIGGTIYNVVISNGIAIYASEKFLWGLLFAVLALLSLYMVSSSVFALYIVTLPDMTPMRALRAARDLVRYRRWTVLRKVIALPLVLTLIAVIIMLPIILLVTVIAQWAFFVLSIGALVGVNTYMYTLYRELLRE